MLQQIFLFIQYPYNHRKSFKRSLFIYLIRTIHLFKYNHIIYLQKTKLILTLKYINNTKLKTTEFYIQTNMEHNHKNFETSLLQKNPFYCKLNQTKFTLTDAKAFK